MSERSRLTLRHPSGATVTTWADEPGVIAQHMDNGYVPVDLQQGTGTDPIEHGQPQTDQSAAPTGSTVQVKMGDGSVRNAEAKGYGTVTPPASAAAEPTPTDI